MLLATAGNAQTGRSVGSGPSNVGLTKIGAWAGYATEAYEPTGFQQQPDWHVHVTASTTCEDVGSDAFGPCTLVGDIFFHVVSRTVNGRTVKTCEPFTDVAGNNAFTQYNPSTGYEIDGGGTGFMSPAYDSDQAQPVHAQSHLHFETSNAIGDTHAVVITGLGAPIRACAVVTSANKVAMAGSIFVAN